MEEGTELLSRIQNGGKLPMITSCSPGWINYAEYNYGDLLEHLSSCKSPHQPYTEVLNFEYNETNFFSEDLYYDGLHLDVYSGLPIYTEMLFGR